MPKKIIDIVPPHTTFREEKRKLSLKKTAPPLISGKKRWRGKLIGGIILIFLVTAGFLLHFVFSKAEIIISPETEPLNLKGKVIVGEDIPGRFFEKETSATQEFPSSGKTLKEEKARGVIRIYNSYSTSPQTLVANTQFMSAEEKLFKSIKKVEIPGGKYEKGKLVPGYLDIDVIAAEAGEEYNIGPSAFAIVKFAGTPKYTAFRGESFSPMTGGLKAQVAQVTEGDLERAKSILLEKLKKESIDSLKMEIPSGFILADETISQEVIEATSSAKAGAQLDSFNFQIRIKTKGLSFQRSDLENFAKEFIKLDIPQGKKVQEESLKLDFPIESVDLQKGKVVLNLTISAKMFTDIDLASLKEELLGKSFEETQLFLKEVPGVIKVRLEPFPFWLKKVPEDANKVGIKIELD